MAEKVAKNRKSYLKDERFLKELGEQIRTVRKSKYFTQEELANAINMDISQISRLERGILNASISMLKEIATALNMSLNELLDFNYTQELLDNKIR